MTGFPKYEVEFTATSLFSPAIYNFRWPELGIEPELLAILLLLASKNYNSGKQINSNNSRFNF